MTVSTDVSKTEIVAGLRQLGIVRGDVLLVHSSLRAFGVVDGGAEAVVDAVLEAVGPDGLAIMPALTSTFVDTSSCTGQVFDPVTTPSRVGFITETFRRRPEAHRSTHYTHSLCAIGPRAAELVETPAGGTTFDLRGPYGRYVDWGAKIAFLGVYPTCNTTLHVLEDWLEMPYMTTERVRVLEGGRPVMRTATRSPWGCRGFYKKYGFIHRLFEARGLYRRARVRQTELIGGSARDTIDVTARAEEQHPGVLLLYDDGQPCSRELLDGVLGEREGILKRLASLRAQGCVRP